MSMDPSQVSGSSEDRCASGGTKFSSSQDTDEGVQKHIEMVDELKAGSSTAEIQSKPTEDKEKEALVSDAPSGPPRKRAKTEKGKGKVGEEETSADSETTMTDSAIPGLLNLSMWKGGDDDEDDVNDSATSSGAAANANNSVECKL